MIYTHIAAALLGAAIAATGAWQVQAWRWGAADADRLRAEQVAQEARETDARQQRSFADQAAGRHAQQLATINTQLGDARAHIARLSSRPCLSAGTVGMLNHIGAASGLGVRTHPGQLAGAPPAPAAPAPDDAAGYATERDTAAHIATCRASYAAVSDQLNQILDIEDRRQQGHAAAHP
ncbi:MAG: hypothetical protein RBS27_01500 [Giesbergeria sp.]|nr:hypothetical protein [Giesbergeria sp.]